MTNKTEPLPPPYVRVVGGGIDIRILIEDEIDMEIVRRALAMVEIRQGKQS